jgi:hypothetical protein
MSELCFLTYEEAVNVSTAVPDPNSLLFGLPDPDPDSLISYLYGPCSDPLISS